MNEVTVCTYCGQPLPAKYIQSAFAEDRKFCNKTCLRRTYTGPKPKKDEVKGEDDMK